jgi:hypothetical protein
MARTRAADDFATIRARMDELRQEQQRRQPPAATVESTNIIGHRGPCACGLSLFADECDGACKAL